MTREQTIAKLRIDCERLRAALDVIAYAKGGAGPALRECVVIARAALEDTATPLIERRS